MHSIAEFLGVNRGRTLHFRIPAESGKVKLPRSTIQPGKSLLCPSIVISTGKTAGHGCNRQPHFYNHAFLSKIDTLLSST